jgi:RNA polymerase sigma-70 factor (sigma-E family)
MDGVGAPGFPVVRAGAGDRPGSAASAVGVTALYRAHAKGLVRLAVVMLGDRHIAEDVVHDAFLGLYRHWERLSDPSRALPYLRSSVLNGCRSALRKRRTRDSVTASAGARAAVPLESAEAWALLGEEHREVLAALKRLPGRQREALVLRFYLDMSEDEIAATMRISRGTVKSATSRGIAALGRQLQERGLSDER